MRKLVLCLAWVFLLLVASVGYGEVTSKPINKEQLQRLKAKENQVVSYFDEEGKRAYSKSRSFYYRKLLKVNDDGSYVIQDFYSKSDKKQVDPVTLTDMKEFYAWATASVDGSFVHWYENGQKEQQSFYVKGNIEGKRLTWYPSGAKESEGNYKAGKAEGTFLEWYESGAKKAESFYVNGWPEGEVKTWHKSGALASKVVYEKGKAQGNVTEWYENGQQKSLGFMLEGKLEGFYKTWYKDGQLETETYYREGKIEGKVKKWDKEGNLLWQRNFQKGHIVWPKSQG